MHSCVVQCVPKLQERERKIVSESVCVVRPELAKLIAQLDDLCYQYLDFCVDHLVSHPRYKEIYNSAMLELAGPAFGEALA